MKEEILRTLNKLEDMGWIKMNDKILPEAISAVFVEIMKEMPLNKFIEIHNIYD